METKWIMLGIGAIIVLVILVSSAEATSWWYSSFWWRDNIGTILILAFFLALVGIIVGGSSDPRTSKGNSPLERALRGLP